MSNTVPKYLANRPDIRARELVSKGLVYHRGDKLYQVAGRNAIYDVFRMEDVLCCACPAGVTNRICSHALAVALYIQKEKNIGSSRGS